MNGREDAGSLVRAFLSRSFDTRDLADADDIFARGFVTSLFAMQLVEFIENQFGIVVETDDLEIENFQSIAAVVRFVGRKTSLAGAA